MPGFYSEDEYDLAGFSAGIVDKSKIPNKNNVQNGDIIIGLASSGVHSNGFSLIRKVFNIDDNNSILESCFNELGCTLGESLLKPTKIYVKPVLELLKNITVRSICHITGGGFFENIPRAFGENMGAVIQKSSFDIPPIFKIIASSGKIPERDMFNTFNMGIGMCVIVKSENADEAVNILRSSGEKTAIIGEIRKDSSGVTIE